MLIIWLDFGRFLVEIYFSLNFSQTLDMFLQGQTFYWPYLNGIVDPIDVKQIGSASASAVYWVSYVILTLDLTDDHDHGFFIEVT